MVDTSQAVGWVVVNQTAKRAKINGLVTRSVLQEACGGSLDGWRIDGEPFDQPRRRMNRSERRAAGFRGRIA